MCPHYLYRCSAQSYFVSQNWEGRAGSGVGGPNDQHCDNDRNTKLLYIQNIKAHLGIPDDMPIYIWYVCGMLVY